MKKNFETFGNYILLEKLAAGGMAEVYLAKKIAASGVQKFVAIKRILSQFSDSEDFISMFKDEAKIAINLSHSNVVSIYDFGTEKGQFYIVMEFVEGRNLRQILNRMKRVDKVFTIAQVAHIIKQVSAGLDHAHRCIDPTTGKPLNIIHRDMSPQNVMLGFEGDAKIVDFGIAKAAHQIEATRAGTLKGKFGYMSPEQVEGQSVDSRTDIFALGIMIWEMLANQRLFLANSEINTLRKIRECDVPSLRKINPNIPTELDQIVKKALEKEKVNRYQTSSDLHRDLQGFLSRFDPDFSVQDFSHFVKGLFSEEIVQIRKKQIVYAQVTVQSQKEQNQGDSTQIVNTESFVHKDDMSLDSLSFDQMSSQGKKVAGDSAMTYTGPSTEELANMDFGDAEFDDGKTRAQRIQIAKRNAHKKVKEYKNQTYTNTSKTLSEIERKNRNATTFTVLFSLSFLLVFFAYINKYHPNFKTKFCESMASYNLCPRSIYIPANLLQIKTQPAGAAIYINGENIGRTPYDYYVKKLPLKVGVMLEGHKRTTKVIDEIPENNSVLISMPRVPTGYLVIKSVGVEIYINDVAVPSGRRHPVPANEDVVVRVRNPISGLSKEKVFRVKPGKTVQQVIDPPESGR